MNTNATVHWSASRFTTVLKVLLVTTLALAAGAIGPYLFVPASPGISRFDVSSLSSLPWFPITKLCFLVLLFLPLPTLVAGTYVAVKTRYARWFFSTLALVLLQCGFVYFYIWRLVTLMIR